MEDNLTVLHNPRCSKSRSVLKLLSEKNVQPQIIDYLKTPLKKKLIEEILQKLNKHPREILRTNEQAYKDLNLQNSLLGRDQLIKAIIENPILLERPIILANGKAIIGRPPELALTIIKLKAYENKP